MGINVDIWCENLRSKQAKTTASSPEPTFSFISKVAIHKMYVLLLNIAYNVMYFPYTALRFGSVAAPPQQPSQMQRTNPSTGITKVWL